MIELWRWEMHPGEIFTSPGHPVGTVELLHVEQDTLSFRSDSAALEVTAGSSAVARTDTAHHYANSGSSLLVFTMTVAELHR